MLLVLLVHFVAVHGVQLDRLGDLVTSLLLLPLFPLLLPLFVAAAVGAVAAAVVTKARLRRKPCES